LIQLTTAEILRFAQNDSFQAFFRSLFSPLLSSLSNNLLATRRAFGHTSHRWRVFRTSRPGSVSSIWTTSGRGWSASAAAGGLYTGIAGAAAGVTLAVLLHHGKQAALAAGSLIGMRLDRDVTFSLPTEAK